jgi:CHAD domain-containing protein
MSYLIRPGKPLTAEVRRVAEAQYRKAIDILGQRQNGTYQAIHDARKCFKRLRGLFRLVRDAAPDFCASENARVRDIARTLSVVRDATALVEALERLLAAEATAENHDALFAVHRRMAARRDHIAASEADLEGKLASAIAGCEDGIEALGALRLPGKQDKAIAVVAEGAAKNYGRAVRALANAAMNDDIDNWHDLRKRIKYHRMHMQLLSPAWPGEMALRAEVADLAGEALGDDRDLASIDELIATDPDAIGNAEEIAILRTCMTAHSEQLRHEVRNNVKNLLKDDKQVIRSRIAALYREAIC